MNNSDINFECYTDDIVREAESQEDLYSLPFFFGIIDTKFPLQNQNYYYFPENSLAVN